MSDSTTPTTNSDSISTRLVVRDHSQPCEHEGKGTVQFDLGAFVSGGVYQCNVTACPGGRERTLERFPLISNEDFLTLQEAGPWEVWVMVSDVE